jgi:hypothetical protein
MFDGRLIKTFRLSSGSFVAAVGFGSAEFVAFKSPKKPFQIRIVVENTFNLVRHLWFLVNFRP